MNAKKPNNLLAPLVIAGITIGFFTAAYRFVFVKSKQNEEAEKSWIRKYLIQTNLTKPEYCSVTTHRISFFKI